MYPYNVWQWFLFLYIYCFFGWIWETSYVSIRKGKFENRGFMNGPLLPIYGFGALTILLAAIPVRQFPVLVYVFGLISSTLLELFTGMGMQKLFHARYWDYSKQKFNYKGHICLSSSIAWGFFSLIMIYGIHKPVENLVMSLPQQIGCLITFAITFAAASDFSVSFKTAIELRDILVAAEEIKKQVERLERRAEIMEVFMKDSAEKRSEALEAQFEEFVGKLSSTGEELRLELLAEMERTKAERTEKLEALKAKFGENKSVTRLLRRNPDAVSVRHAVALQEYKEKFVNKVKEITERK